MFILLAFLFSIPQSSAKASAKLTVYAYDSFSGKGSLGEKIRSRFESETKAKLEIVPFGSSGEALNQVVLEGDKTRADLVIGIDNGLLPRALKTTLFDDFKSSLTATRSFVVGGVQSWVPFDYGYLAFVYDEKRHQPKPHTTLKTLAQDKRLIKKIAIEDPRTSSIGRLFLIWTYHETGDNGFREFWKGLSPCLLTIAPGWSGAYSLFSQKEADLVLSYTTSPAYHIEFEKTYTIRAMLFPHGHMRQVEGVMLVKRSLNKDLAHRFVEILLSPEIQSAIALTNFMYPAIRGVLLPTSFKELPPEPKALSVKIPDDVSGWIKAWSKEVR